MRYVGMLNDIVEIDILVCEYCGCWFGVDYGFVENTSQECTCPYCSASSYIVRVPEDDHFIIDYLEIDSICAKYDGREKKGDNE